ncbi:MurR/RpiR family transcriptional regulator [Thalassotalea sediminis]|uniref:MurR/RpiR family transcriptional regulator n=1 Tax=Thalassotalea sediminis TaxID=1759089 RepID=UPI0025728F34|nr:MurR/RpiR family transcriptional regulator [Thalassotalea sediminis]
MSVLIKIKMHASMLTAIEKRIADHILNNPNEVKNYSSKTLAQAVNVSQSSIIKFAQKLGYKGYPALKLALIELKPSKHNLHGDISLQDNLEKVSSKLLASKIEMLRNTQFLNDNAQLTDAVSMILNAEKILISGIGASGLVGKDLCFKLQKIGFAAVYEWSGHNQIACSATLNKNDLVICLSESGKTADVIAVAQQARKQGAAVLAITGVGKSKLRKLSETCLYTVSEPSSLRLSSILARTSQALIIDTLFIAITQKSKILRMQIKKSNETVANNVNKQAYYLSAP